MAQRPFVGGAFAVGIVAAALHLTTASGPPSSSQSSGASSASGIHGKHAVTPESSPYDRLLWSDEMKNHPENLGRLSAQKELNEAIGDFYTAPLEQAASTPRSSTQPVASACKTLKMMIAIEPDPAHTHLALRFDRDLDALDDALQDSGWRYQSNWLPWSPMSSSPSGGQFADREQQRLFLEGREELPGVLLFRPTEMSLKSQQAREVRGEAPSNVAAGMICHPLAVFVVGNSPTGGINRTQFLEVLSRLKSLSPNQTELSILGPSFTGSGPSLRALLSSDEIKNLGLQKITIASGSISDPRCDHLLPAGESKSGRCTSPNIPNTTFVSFGIDRDWRIQQTIKFLRKYGRFGNDDIAELNEDESSYGSFQPQPLPSQPLRLYFPRNISHLRSAYEKSNIFGFGASTQARGNISLNLDFAETSDDDDAIPTFAEQMPVSQDGVMHQISDVLEQHRIKVVLLSATDVLDEIFVAEILARQAPNTLVIINQSDDLFLRASSAGNFDNLYFVSPWPLSTDSQLWSRPVGSEFPSHVFPSDLSEGLYAAARYLVHSADRSIPPVPFNLPDYTSPLSQTNRPSLWLSTIGHGDYWPVALLDDVHDSLPPSLQRSDFILPAIIQEQQPTGIFEIELTPPLSQQLLLLTVCLFALYHGAKCVQIPALHDLSFRYAIDDPGARAPKLFLQLSMTVLFLLLLQLCISPHHYPPLAQGAFQISTATLCVAAVYLIWQIVLLIFPGLNPGLNSSQLWPTFVVGMVIVVLSCGLFFLVMGLWQCLWDKLSSPSGFPDFFIYRASYPLRGISPIFPLFLATAALVVFFYNHLDRIAFTRDIAPHLPCDKDGPPNCPTGRDLDLVTSFVAWPPKLPTIMRKAALLAGIGVFVIVLIKPFHLRPRMFEGLHLQKTLGLAMFLLTVLILWELILASMLWHRLKAVCLDPLESSTLRGGFNTVSGLTWRSFWILSGNRHARYRAISRLLEQGSRSVLDEEASSPQEGPNLRLSTREMQQKIKQLHDAENPSTPQEVVEAFGRVQKEIGRVADMLLSKLRVSWFNESNRITAPDTIKTEEDPAPCTPGPPIDCVQQLREEWVALVYIHYIRMVLLHIRSRLFTAASLYLFLVWAGTSYPYLNRHVLLIALSALLGVLSFAIISVYASINRDAILSRSTNHKPGHLDLDFYVKVASFVGIPFVGFVASQFPEVSSFLFSWIEPGISAVK